jgi:hypothetical protein
LSYRSCTIIQIYGQLKTYSNHSVPIGTYVNIGYAHSGEGLPLATALAYDEGPFGKCVPDN